jgi:hypothetical protein
MPKSRWTNMLLAATGVYAVQTLMVTGGLSIGNREHRMLERVLISAAFVAAADTFLLPPFAALLHFSKA